MVAVGLLYGDLKSEYYSDVFASSDPRIDVLRDKMTVIEDMHYSQLYLDSQHRATPNSVQVFFNDGTSTQKVEIYYPLGHKQRRDSALPFLQSKYSDALNRTFSAQKQELVNLWDMPIAVFSQMTVHDFMSKWIKE